MDIRTGIANSAATSDHARDVSSSQSSKKGRMSADLERWSQRRNAKVAIAGEEPVASLEGQLKNATVFDSQGAADWKATKQCTLAHTKLDYEKQFCKKVEDLKAKITAAKDRDELDKNKPQAAEDVEVTHATVDGYIDSVTLILDVLADDKAKDAKDDKDAKAKSEKDAKTKELIARSWDWEGGIALALFGALGPYGLLRWLGLTDHAHREAPKPESQPQPQPEAARKPEKTPKAKVAPIVAETPENGPATIPAIVATSQNDDPELDAFIDGRLEAVQGKDNPSTPVWKAWEQHCSERGIDPGSSQKAFCQRMQARGVGYTRGGNRPRYLNVRLKPAPVRAEHAPLRLAVVNG